MTKPLITPSMRGWTAVVGDAPELQWKGERGYFPHVEVPSCHYSSTDKLIINTGGWPIALHDDHARLIAAAPSMLIELARAWYAAPTRPEAAGILRVIATARNMTTDEAQAAIMEAGDNGKLK